MGFDIRAIFARSLGGRDEHIGPPRTSDDDAREPDEEPPTSPIMAALDAAANPDTDDMAQGGATASTALIPEGVDSIPDAAVDRTSARADEDVTPDQALSIAEVATTAALLHGPISTAQLDDLLESLREVPGLETLDQTQLDDLLDAIRAETADAGMHEFIEYLEARLDELGGVITDPTLRRAAYQLAVYFTAWDGPLDEDEIGLLEMLADAFEIPDGEARSLREATIVEADVEPDALPPAP